MSVEEKSSRVVFGLFEADLETGELWKSGRRIRLQSQPFRILTALVLNAGRVVTRVELQSEVWGSDTNVDFDRALAGAINKIREALGDSAENPRFVETLAKRGYRFIAPVSAVPIQSPVGVEIPGEAVHGHHGHTASSPVDSAAEAANYSPETAGDGETQAPSAHKPWGAHRDLAYLLVIALLLICVAVASWKTRVAVPPRVEQLTYESPISSGPPNEESFPGLATDGDRILTSVLADGRPQLADIYIGTGDLHRWTLPQELASVSLADISRDGARVLVLGLLSTATEQPLWVVPLGGSGALRVGNVLAHDATWMPDGSSILYANGNDLAVIRLTGEAPTTVATLPGRAFWLRWSPDGKLLRFTLIDPLRHTRALWEMQAGSNAPHPLREIGEGHTSACCGIWTADGEDYVFEEARTGGTDLWAMKSRGLGTTLTQLTNGPLHYFSPVAARSGHRIFFLGSDLPLGLQQFDAKSREFIPYRAFLSNAVRVSYSRDGRWVAWTDMEGRLWQAHADGSDKLQLTASDMDVFSAIWSPDGRVLALMARMQGQAWQIYQLDAGGGALKQLLKEPRNDADPTWSPDGRSLAFGGEGDRMGKESGPRSIRILNAATGAVTTLPDSEGMFSPRWSPDGRWIAALSLDQNQVMLYDSESRKWRQLAVISAADPAWSSDGKALYINAFLEDKQPIVRISVPTGEMQPVASLADLHTKDAANYFFCGLTSDDQPLVLPRVGTSNLFTIDLDR